MVFIFNIYLSLNSSHCKNIEEKKLTIKILSNTFITLKTKMGEPNNKTKQMLLAHAALMSNLIKYQSYQYLSETRTDTLLFL